MSTPQISYYRKDTIAAKATPVGRGGIGIIRVSGDLAPQIARQILGKLPKARFAECCAFFDDKGIMIDNGIALYFEAPNSFTGEHVLELQGHGGAIVMDLVLARVLELGARLAKAGEFSERAFYNDKLDLIQAEAIVDLIDAGSAEAARSAARSLQGAFGTKIAALRKHLIAFRVEVETSIDFSEEDLDFKTRKHQITLCDDMLVALASMQNDAKQGLLLQEGIKIVIAGKPNVGKSSLLNVLTHSETAIVSDIPGTTRDILQQRIYIDGLPIHILDTAGIQTTDDVIEKEGVRRTHNAIKEAEHILYLIDASTEPCRDLKTLAQKIPALAANSDKLTFVFNKIDLTSESSSSSAFSNAVYLSTKTLAGIDSLKAHLKTKVGFHTCSEIDTKFSARRRHLALLKECEARLKIARHNLGADYKLELIAEDLRQAQRSLDEITGAFTTEELLTKIFREFCIGK